MSLIFSNNSNSPNPSRSGCFVHSFSFQLLACNYQSLAHGFPPLDLHSFRYPMLSANLSVVRETACSAPMDQKCTPWPNEYTWSRHQAKGCLFTTKTQSLKASQGKGEEKEERKERREKGRQKDWQRQMGEGRKEQNGRKVIW